MESIKQLRLKLQTTGLGLPILQRGPSIYLTWLAVPTTITANQVSAAMILVGLLGSATIIAGYPWVGLGLVYLNEVLDCVDGEVARYRGTFSLRGLYLDLVNHLTTQAVFFLALTFWISTGVPQPWSSMVLLFGMLGAISMPLRRANGDLHRDIFVHHYARYPERYPLPILGEPSATTTPTKTSLFKALVRSLFKIVYYSEYLTYMIVVFAVALFVEQVFFAAYTWHPVLVPLIVLYSVVSCVYLVKEVIGAFFDMERRIAQVRAGLAKKRDDLFQ